MRLTLPVFLLIFWEIFAESGFENLDAFAPDANICIGLDKRTLLLSCYESGLKCHLQSSIANWTENAT